MYKLAIVDRQELEMGIKKEMTEHGMSEQKARKTAMDHLRENPHYYSIASGVGLEDEMVAEDGQIKRQFVKRMKKIPSRLTKLKKHYRKGPATAVGSSLPGPTGAGIG
jgi:hypothetical protein